MARIRTVKPDYWKSEKLATRLPGPDGREARRLFIGLWNLAEDHGVCRGAAAYIRSELYPYDLDVTTADVERWVALLIAGGFVTRFVREGSTYLWIRGFADHQRINRPTKPTLPLPTEAERADVAPPTMSPHGVVSEDSVSAHGGLSEDSLREGKGREGKGNGTEVEGKRLKPRDPPPPDDSGAGFYADAQNLRTSKLQLPAEPPPRNPDKLSRWYGPALGEFQGDRAWMLAAYERFLADPFWAKAAPPYPFAAFAKEPTRWAGKRDVEPTAEEFCEFSGCTAPWQTKIGHDRKLCYRHYGEAAEVLSAGPGGTEQRWAAVDDWLSSPPAGVSP